MSYTAATVMLFSAVSIRAAPAICLMFSLKTTNRLCMLIFLRRYFYKGIKCMQVPYTATFFGAVSIRAAIFIGGRFFEIYIHYGVFNRGTNLVTV